MASDGDAGFCAVRPDAATVSAANVISIRRLVFVNTADPFVVKVDYMRASGRPPINRRAATSASQITARAAA